MAERTSATIENLSMDQSSLVYGIVVCKRIFFISEPIRHPGSDVIHVAARGTLLQKFTGKKVRIYGGDEHVTVNLIADRDRRRDRHVPRLTGISPPDGRR